jgi:hypothetical protein
MTYHYVCTKMNFLYFLATMDVLDKVVGRCNHFNGLQHYISKTETN